MDSSFLIPAAQVRARREQRQQEAATAAAAEQHLGPNHGRHAAIGAGPRHPEKNRPPRNKKPIIPPALYLPSTGAPNTYGAEIELRKTNDGRMALLAYTALDRLADCMGPYQPWVLYPTERMPATAARTSPA